MAPKKDRAGARQRGNPTMDSTEIKVGDSFVVLRKVTDAQGVTTNQKCLATIVKVREQESAMEGDAKPREVIVSKLPGPSSGGFPSMKCSRQYYVHYDGMDKRMDEWLERDQILEKVKPGSTTSSSAFPKSTVGNPEGGTMTRRRRRIYEEFNHVQKSYEDMGAMTALLEKEHDEMTKVKNIEEIRYGKYWMDAWYASPYPKEFANLRKLWICEFCMAYMKCEQDYWCHMRHLCSPRQPPGEEIYRKDAIAVFEVDGTRKKPYCQCLCLLSKLFLDHKTLFYDVGGFLFYVLCEVDDNTTHVVGYFSKERNSPNNLSCIMILPPFQRNGYGKFLIDLSYQLSNREGVIGTPEKPLSDLGNVSYRSYWWWVILKTLDALNVQDITVSDLSIASKLREEDIISTLQTVEMVKFWKGEYVVENTKQVLRYGKESKAGRPPKLVVDLEYLKWPPNVKSPTVHERRKLNAGRTA